MAPRAQEEVLAALPALRRYAFALTGERTRGDEYIRVALETLSREPWRLGPSDVKLHLYRLFDDVLGALPIFDSHACEDVDEPDPHHGLKRNLLNLPVLNRKLLLLVVLERFSVAEAARIVQLPAHDVATRLAAARVQLSSLNTIPHSHRIRKAREARAQ